MSHQAGTMRVTGAVEWLKANSAVGESARARAAVPGTALPDALVEDPTRVVEVLKAALVEAIANDAPVGVAEDLLLSLRLSSVGAERFDRDAPAATALRSLKGLRSREEISAALEKNAASPFDEVSRGEFERLRGVVDAMPASDELTILGPYDPSPDPSVGVPDQGGLPDPVVDVVVETGTSTDGTGITEAPDPGAGALDPGGALGAVIGSYLGGASGAEQGAAIGSQLTGGGSGFDGASLGAQIGEALAGPAGGQLGAQIGAQMSSSADSAIDRLIDMAAVVACQVCGPACILCVLAAEAIGEMVQQVIHEAVQ